MPTRSMKAAGVPVRFHCLRSTYAHVVHAVAAMHRVSAPSQPLICSLASARAGRVFSCVRPQPPVRRSGEGEVGAMEWRGGGARGVTG